MKAAPRFYDVIASFDTNRLRAELRRWREDGHYTIWWTDGPRENEEQVTFHEGTLQMQELENEHGAEVVWHEGVMRCPLCHHGHRADWSCAKAKAAEEQAIDDNHVPPQEDEFPDEHDHRVRILHSADPGTTHGVYVTDDEGRHYYLHIKVEDEGLILDVFDRFGEECLATWAHTFDELAEFVFANDPMLAQERLLEGNDA